MIPGLAAVIGAMGSAAFKFLIDLWRGERDERRASDKSLVDGVTALTAVSRTNGELAEIVKVTNVEVVEALKGLGGKVEALARAVEGRP